MQGTHMFRRDRICQIIKCNPWSTSLHSHSTIIKKIKTYLELEGKLGPKLQPQPNQSRPAQPDTNPCVRKDTKATEKRKKLIPAKKYKVKAVAKPNSTNAIAQPPLTTPNAPVNSENQKPLQESTLENNPPPPENIPVCTSPPWPEAGKMSGNLFQLRKRLAGPSY